MECPVGSGAEHPTYDTYFDINVHIMDHSASLINCRLSGKTAEAVLGVKVCTYIFFPRMIRSL